MQIQTSHSTLSLGLTVEKLLADLEDNFPPSRPSPCDKIEEIMYRSGQRSVVEYIKQVIDDDD
jgi:hypothetical protein